MLKQRRQAAESVAEALFAAEKAIDAAITSTAALAGLMPTTRQDANLSALVGQDALMAAITTMQALGAAREGIVVTHKHLSVAQHDIGLSAVSFGEGAVKPAGLIETNTSGRLTVAA
ncbi:hypothetical protein [Caulobacter sp. FWC2]|uniref:hypothetical protein n=1 Tax=Caulobacter sp. FWC2 TaxID=69664 RepID=UPI000C14654C|nr:hypothetical protein [Caulobacter sp. FWC2]PIB90691.1 hypothetical protein CSW62_03365 [Caulobacter sp. FWC2]